METALVAIAVVACPVGMGLCMWMMARGMRGQQKEESAGPQASVADLRREQDQIAARIEELERDGDGKRTPAPR